MVKVSAVQRDWCTGQILNGKRFSPAFKIDKKRHDDVDGTKPMSTIKLYRFELVRAAAHRVARAFSTEKTFITLFLSSGSLPS